MTTPASHLDFHLRREVDRRWATAGVRHTLRLLAWASPLFVVGFIPLPIDARWIVAARVGLGAVLILGLIAWFGERRRLMRDGQNWAAADLGARSPHPDLVVAGAWLKTHDESSRLAPLVLSEAESVAAGLSPAKRVEFFARDLWMVVLSGAVSLALFTVLRAGSDSPLVTFVRKLVTSEPELTSPGVDRATESKPTESRAAASDALIQLTMKSDRRIYKLECPIELKIMLESHAQLTADVPIEVRLAISDGLPYPDAGFGDGFRVVSLPLGWTVPATPGRREQRVPILDLMKRLQLYRPGLFTLQIAASPFDLMGNQVVFEVTERIEDEPITIRQPMGTSEQPEKREAANKPPKKGDTDGPKTIPKLGDPDRLPEARRVAKAIEPLLSDGPTIEKEVSVWDREKGGDAPPPPPPPPIPKPVAPREFTRQPESGIPKPDVTPADRDAMRRYFRRVDG